MVGSSSQTGSAGGTPSRQSCSAAVSAVTKTDTRLAVKASGGRTLSTLPARPGGPPPPPASPPRRVPRRGAGGGWGVRWLGVGPASGGGARAPPPPPPPPPF